MNIWRSCFSTVINLAKKATRLCLFGYFSFLFLAGWPWLYSIYFNFDFNFCFYSRLGDLDWMNGAMSGTVYNSSHELGALMTEVLLFICFLLVCFCLGWIANLLDDLIGGWLDLVIFWRLFILCDDPMATTRCKKPFLFVCLIFLFGLDCDDPMPPTRCTAWQPGPTLFTLTPSQGWERWKPR